MTILELYQKGFNAAVEELAEQHDDITTYETLKEFIKSKIDADNLIVATHLTDALNTCEYAEYYRYDYCMGTLETPTPLKDESDLEEFCDGKTFTVDAHINSLGGKMDEITVFEERQNGNQKYYIVRYKDVFCTAIFNGFTCSYYADDVYGRIEQ